MIVKTIMQCYEDIRFQAGNDARKHTCHFFEKGTYRGCEVPLSIGSGVFVEVDENYLLFTAAHVVEKKPSDIFVGLDTKVGVVLNGYWIRNKRPENLKNNDEDKIDAAILILDKQSVAKVLERYEFLSYNEIEINHIFEENAPSYVTVGYPESKNKKSEKGLEHESLPFIYSNGVILDNNIYNKLGCDISQNVIVPYNKKNTINRTTNQSKAGLGCLNGISGGGLWYVPPQFTKYNAKADKKLVGVITEWDKAKKYLIVTRIDEFLRLLQNLPQGVNLKN